MGLYMSLTMEEMIMYDDNTSTSGNSENEEKLNIWEKIEKVHNRLSMLELIPHIEVVANNYIIENMVGIYIARINRKIIGLTTYNFSQISKAHSKLVTIPLITNNKKEIEDFTIKLSKERKFPLVFINLDSINCKEYDLESIEILGPYIPLIEKKDLKESLIKLLIYRDYIRIPISFPLESEVIKYLNAYQGTFSSNQILEMIDKLLRNDSAKIKNSIETGNCISNKTGLELYNFETPYDQYGTTISAYLS